MDVKITDLSELCSLLGRLYWVESEMELMGQWDAYTEVGERYRDILFTLSHDSEKHKTRLENLFSKIDGCDTNTVLSRTEREKIELKGKREEEILQEVLKYDQLALDLYRRVHSSVQRPLIRERWNGDDPDEFFRTLKWLIEEEKRHVALLKEHVGKPERIR